jgi:AcrR family transcriptional regulator
MLVAARRVFEASGYAGATIEEIAAEAAVAVPTVYKVFTNKRNLLIEVVARAMSGADYGEDVSEQPWWNEQLEEPDPARQLGLIARNARSIYERAGSLLEVVRSAAPLDGEIGAIWNDISDQRLRRSRRTARRLVRNAGDRARVGVEQTAVTLTLLTAPELYAANLAAGRSSNQYQRWLEETLISALLR